jgi:hypothetical protein
VLSGSGPPALLSPTADHSGSVVAFAVNAGPPIRKPKGTVVLVLVELESVVYEPLWRKVGNNVFDTAPVPVTL